MQRTPASGRSSRPRLLVAHDDPMVRDMVLMRLAAAGYDTHTARSGAETLERIVALNPDALLLDIDMPGMDGFEVLEALRTGLPHLDLPVLMLTVRQSAEDVRRALELGARDYLVKAALDTQLLPRVTRMLKTSCSGRVSTTEGSA